MRHPARTTLGCALIAVALLVGGVAPALAEDVVYVFRSQGNDITFDFSGPYVRVGFAFVVDG